MKVYIDKCDLMDMLYRSDIDFDSREEITEKEAIRHAINKLDYMLCIINDAGGTIQYSDINAINECIAVIKDLCKEES